MFQSVFCSSELIVSSPVKILEYFFVTDLLYYGFVGRQKKYGSGHIFSKIKFLNPRNVINRLGLPNVGTVVGIHESRVVEGVV